MKTFLWTVLIKGFIFFGMTFSAISLSADNQTPQEVNEEDHSLSLGDLFEAYRERIFYQKAIYRGLFTAFRSHGQFWLACVNPQNEIYVWNIEKTLIPSITNYRIKSKGHFDPELLSFYFLQTLTKDSSGQAKYAYVRAPTLKLYDWSSANKSLLLTKIHVTEELSRLVYPSIESFYPFEGVAGLNGYPNLSYHNIQADFILQISPRDQRQLSVFHSRLMVETIELSDFTSEFLYSLNRDFERHILVGK
jgi:hypothetical protein